MRRGWSLESESRKATRSFFSWSESPSGFTAIEVLVTATPILFTGAAYYLPFLPGDVTDQFMHLGYHVLILSTQSPDVEATKPLLYGTVFVLLALTFLLNLTGVLIRTRTRSRLQR